MTDTKAKVPCFDRTLQIGHSLEVTKSWRDQHPFWTGVIVGVVGLFAWNRRGAIIGLGRKLMHPSQLFHGAAIATGIELPSADPNIAVRQMKRYAFAASQDKSPIVGLTHASYALIALDIIEEAVGREAILAKGYDPTQLRTFIAGLQDMHAKNLEACDPYLASTLALEQSAGRTAQPSGMFAGVSYTAPTGA